MRAPAVAGPWHDVVVSEPVPADRIRVSDAERRAVQDMLLRAQGEGLLDIGEYDERVQAVWNGKTRGDLARVTADLPDIPPAPPAGRDPVRPAPARPKKVFSDTGGGTAMRVLTIVFSSIVAVNVLVWGIVSVTNFDLIYPWFVWTLIPLVVLAVLYASGIGRSHDDR
ncbi:protein of unknown function DUF1707 [Pseudonocardia dioxanivorans CB1190]|uniref:DUF1707 domain-containing protein n=1 Tax=Pseudonocardia dioxanivorans (strain ATCC 55486 / DSM 44775 / JCM 13855 / CB1190) TaxID=675635 RepID=F4CIP9_PSEUX|nr:protein of unknown function DUF1707 [Pseudonocardia dioxanivorans CB1190]